jgi:hypothetical protein
MGLNFLQSRCPSEQASSSWNGSAHFHPSLGPFLCSLFRVFWPSRVRRRFSCRQLPDLAPFLAHPRGPCRRARVVFVFWTPPTTVLASAILISTPVITVYFFFFFFLPLPFYSHLHHHSTCPIQSVATVLSSLDQDARPLSTKQSLISLPRILNAVLLMLVTVHSAWRTHTCQLQMLQPTPCLCPTRTLATRAIC